MYLSALFILIVFLISGCPSGCPRQQNLESSQNSADIELKPSDLDATVSSPDSQPPIVQSNQDTPSDAVEQQKGGKKKGKKKKKKKLKKKKMKNKDG